MIGVTKEINYRMLKHIRLLRNMRLVDFSAVCKIDPSTLAKLERGEILLSPYYESKILDGCRALRITQIELESIKQLITLREKENND